MANITKEQAAAANTFRNLPRNKYGFRCVSSKLTNSKRTGAPMFAQEWEIIDPEVVEVDGAEVKTDKIKIRHWIVFSEKAASMVFDFYNACGMELESFDPDDEATLPEAKSWEGVCISALLRVEDRTPLGPDGKPIVDDNGKPVSDGVNYSLGTVLGVRENPSEVF